MYKLVKKYNFNNVAINVLTDDVDYYFLSPELSIAMGASRGYVTEFCRRTDYHTLGVLVPRNLVPGMGNGGPSVYLLKAKNALECLRMCSHSAHIKVYAKAAKELHKYLRDEVFPSLPPLEAEPEEAASPAPVSEPQVYSTNPLLLKDIVTNLQSITSELEMIFGMLLELNKNSLKKEDLDQSVNTAGLAMVEVVKDLKESLLRAWA